MPTYKEMHEMLDRVNKDFKERDIKRAQEKERATRKNCLEPEKVSKQIDHPSTIENSTATFLWIVSLIGGAIFKEAVLIWVASTIVWWKFINRHNHK